MFDEHGASTTLSIFGDPQTGGQTVSIEDGEAIYSADTPADSIYHVQRGQVRLYSVNSDQSSRLLEIYGPGQWFGVPALAGTSTYQMRAVAVSNVTVTRISVSNFLIALSKHPEQSIEMARQLAGRLVACTEDASQLIFEDCNQRLIRALVRFSGSAASTRQDDEVTLRITHDQLAQAVGVARETVSLALTQLRQQNLLRTGRNQLVFNPEALRQFASGLRNGGEQATVAPAESVV